MALPVRENASPMTRLHDEIDRMFQDFTSAGFWPWRERSMRLPTLDVREKGDNLVVEAELPGIGKDDVKITYADSSLTIQGETKKDQEEKREGYYRAEREYGSFYRVVPLPQPVSFEKAAAEFKDGVLTITLPKAPRTEEKARSIPISG